MTEVLPGILEKDFDKIKRNIDLVKDFVEWIHIDVLDNTLIPNNTYNNWEAFKIYNGQVKFEAHLMVSDPKKYVEPLVRNGFDRLVAHVEGDSVRDFIHECRIHQVEVGVALDGPSPLELVEPYLGEIDCVTIMMYKSGASGQTFQREQLTKIKKISEEYKELPIEVDGGIDKSTAILVIENGATRLVSTSYLFWKNRERIEEAIEEIRTI